MGTYLLALPVKGQALANLYKVSAMRDARSGPTVKQGEKSMSLA